MKLCAYRHRIRPETIRVAVRMAFMVIFVKLVCFKSFIKNLIKKFIKWKKIKKEINECEIVVNGLKTTPCQNNATCYDLVDAYYCEYDLNLEKSDFLRIFLFKLWFLGVMVLLLVKIVKHVRCIFLHYYFFKVLNLCIFPSI
jgi:hypothetical protein